MNTENILNEIKNNLTGEPAADVMYLMSQIDAYREDKELVRELGALMYSVLPQQSQNELSGIVSGYDTPKRLVEDAEDAYAEGDMEEAVSILEEALDMGLSLQEKAAAEDKNVTYKWFDSVIDRYIYLNLIDRDAVIRQPSLNFSRIYYLLGCAYIQLGRNDEGEDALKKAVEWNPLCFDARCELIALYRSTHRLAQMKDDITDMLKYVYRPSYMAFCYGELGHYYIKLTKYEIGFAMISFALEFDPDYSAGAEMFMISQLCGHEIKPVTADSLSRICRIENIPCGINSNVLSVINAVGDSAAAEGISDLARECYEHIYNATGDPEFKEKSENS